ncbi:MAG: hypothetical protein H6730_15930 [Deltaproteobacteria bacterium]|nr:hypothetical protein [Deltaproteobacteria bacterium]
MPSDALARMLRAGARATVRIPCRTLTLALAALSLAACGGGDPSVSVTADKSSLASGDTVTLTVTVENFELRAPAQALRAAHGDEEQTAGEVTSDGGHYHVYLDSTDVNPLTMAWTPTVNVTVTASTGPHQLIVRLNADDHRFLVPEVKAHVDLTVE